MKVLFLLGALLVPLATCQTTTEEPDDGYDCVTDGFFAHPKYCEYYYICEDGNDTLVLCNPDLFMLFDTRTSECNWPEATHCGDRERPEDYPGTVTPPDPTTQPSTTPEPIFDCPVPDGKFPDPDDCSSYFVCSNGFPFRLTCAPPTLYSVEEEDCDFPGNVDCGDRPIP